MKTIRARDERAMRRRADKYIGKDGQTPKQAPEPRAFYERDDRSTKIVIPDAGRQIARFLYACPMGMEAGGVELSRAIKALAAVLKVRMVDLDREFGR